VAAFFSGAAMFGALVHVPLLVQWGEGKDATTAGLSLMTMSTGWSVGGLFAGQLLNRLGFRAIAVAGAALMTVGYAALAYKPDIDWMHLMIIGAVTGIGMGMQSITVIVAVQTAIEPARRGVATSGVLFFRNVGSTLGVALMGAILTARLGAGLGGLEAGMRQLPADLIPTLVQGISFVFWLGVGATTLTLIAACFLPDGTPKSAAAAAPGEALG
jgi:MFS family permease